MRILIVEDEATNQEVATVVLESAGHEAVVVGNGQEAIDRLIEGHEAFDLICMDLLMPVLDGVEATRRLRAHPTTQDLPILACSAMASGKDQAEALKAGCDHFITKPFRRNQLLEAVALTVQNREAAIKAR